MVGFVNVVDSIVCSLSGRRENHTAIIDLYPQAAGKSQKLIAQFKAQKSQAEAGIAQAQAETNKTDAALTKWIVQLSNCRIVAEQTLSSAFSNSQQLCTQYHFSYLSERGLLG